MYSELELSMARLSLYAYDYERNNRTGVPDDWIFVKKELNGATGFQAYAFKNNTTGQLIVSFTGTRFGYEEPLNIDWLTNATGAFGSQLIAGSSLQFADAVGFLKGLMDLPPDSDGFVGLSETQKENLFFTGHSLGGGLASFMGTLFDRPTVAFAPAPFEMMARDSATLDYLFDLYLASYTPHGDALQTLAMAAASGEMGSDRISPRPHFSQGNLIFADAGDGLLGDVADASLRAKATTSVYLRQCADMAIAARVSG